MASSANEKFVGLLEKKYRLRVILTNGELCKIAVQIGYPAIWLDTTNERAWRVPVEILGKGPPFYKIGQHETTTGQP